MNRFGEHIRKRREALKNKDPKRFSIRRLSERIGVQSGYLSRIERGKASALSEEKIRALALELGEDEDYLLALAGKVSEDVRAIIRDRPALFAKLIRDMKDLPDSAVEADGEYRKIERRLSQAQAVARIGSWERNFATGETYWSEFMYEIFGFDEFERPPGYEEVVSRVHPDDREIFHEVTRPGEPGEMEEDCRYRLIRPDGSLMHVSARVKVERGEDGSPLRIIGCSQDVTEQVETRRKLVESERLWRTLAENIPGCDVFLFDRDLRFLAAAGSEVERFGYSREHFLGRTLYETLDPETAAMLEPHYLKPLRGEESRMEFDFGEAGYLAHAVPVYDKQGRPYLGLGLVMNVTELKQAEHALQEAYVGLEQQVRKRTAELAQAKRKLEEELLSRWTAEKALAESERLYRTLVETIPYGVEEVDTSGRRVFTNPALNLMLGYDPGDLTGTMLWNDIRDPESIEGFKAYLEQLFREEPAPRPYHCRSVKKDGAPVDLLIDWNFKRDDQGNVLGTIAVVTDVSEQKRAERELEEQRELFNTFADQIPGVAFIKDETSRLLFVNKMMDNVYDAANWLGKRPTEFMPEEIAAELMAADRKTLAEGPQIFEQSIPDKTGTWRNWLEYKFPINRQGKPPLLGCVSLDVTEVKAYEEALAESEARYRALAEQSPVSIMAFDARGVITFVNDWHLKVFAKGKLGADFFLGRKVTELPGLVSAGAAEKIGKILEGLSVSIDELHIPTFAAGHEGWQSVHGVPLILEGRLAGGVLIRQDISEQVRARERIEQSLAEKETLLQEIHHRVKNNMQVVSGLMDMAARRVRAKEAKAALKDMQAKMRSMALIHSMIYRGDRLDKVDFGSYVRMLYSELASMYSDTAARVRAEMRLESVYLPLNTAVPLSIVLNEALTNAFKHAFPQDRSGTIEILLQRRNSQIMLRISDDGIGPSASFDPETIDSIGIRLIRDITRLQLQGSVDFDNDHGFSLELRLPELNEETNAT